VSQPVGKRTIVGSGGNSVECDGETRWDVTVAGQNGRFAGGRASANVLAVAFDFETGTLVEAFASGAVRLKSQRK